MKRYYSHGKLLLTGEYLVLDGALSLAIPTRFGQDLIVEENSSAKLHWTGLDKNGNVWIEETFKIENNEIQKHPSNTLSLGVQNDDSVSNRLLQLLKATKHLNPKFLNENKGYKVTTSLEFPKNWGLGTSSTLVNNIANWASVNPYQLLELTFSGSGYDIACAEAKTSITYQNIQDENLKQVLKDKRRAIKSVNFNPSFKDNLYFVHLNQKQNSRDGIKKYRANASDLSDDIKQINKITTSFIDCNSLDNFQELMNRHEEIISKIICHKPVKEQLFNDFDGSIKSLGAWGGDFVLVASKHKPTSYFADKGYSTILEYNQMIFK